MYSSFKRSAHNFFLPRRYAKGTFEAYILFGTNYPQAPPDIRFVTPVRHCNINAYGKICHSVFDRNWSPSATVFFLLSHVWGLFFQPDTEDPLDSVLALSFYEDFEAYGIPRFSLFCMVVLHIMRHGRHVTTPGPPHAHVYVLHVVV